MFEELPKKKYGVILADPPWTFKTFSEKGQGKSPQRHYSCESLEALCSLPVHSVAADDSVLFLWATWPLIFSAKTIIEAWGFTYSGLAWEWIKYNPKTEKYSFGGGYGTRKNVEPCLLARRGKPKRYSASERDLLIPEDDFIISPRREHSRKPDEQYQKMQRLFAGPYLELFSRNERPHWDSWGDEIGKFN